MPTEVITDALKVITNYAQSQILMIPGMPMIASYVKSSYQNDPFRVGLEALLIFFTLRYLLSAPKGSEVQLTPKVNNKTRSRFSQFYHRRSMNWLMNGNLSHW